MSSGIAFLDFEIMEILLSAVLVAMFTMPQSAVCSLVPADFKSAGTETDSAGTGRVKSAGTGNPADVRA